MKKKIKKSKKFESSKADKMKDKMMGLKEGSKKDNKLDTIKMLKRGMMGKKS